MDDTHRTPAPRQGQKDGVVPVIGRLALGIEDLDAVGLGLSQQVVERGDR